MGTKTSTDGVEYILHGRQFSRCILQHKSEIRKYKFKDQNILWIRKCCPEKESEEVYPANWDSLIQSLSSARAYRRRAMERSDKGKATTDEQTAAQVPQNSQPRHPSPSTRQLTPPESACATDTSIPPKTPQPQQSNAMPYLGEKHTQQGPTTVGAPTKDEEWSRLNKMALAEDSALLDLGKSINDDIGDPGHQRRHPPLSNGTQHAKSGYKRQDVPIGNNASHNGSAITDSHAVNSLDGSRIMPLVLHHRWRLSSPVSQKVRYTQLAPSSLSPAKVRVTNIRNQGRSHS
ncbi:hypothetical protein FBULB1_13545 [Fusarium bulbicola]|nr:hypothetical protein FBULB1_13545 [Fusarium bulbicola]